MVRAGEAAAIMKGSLHTDEVMAAVVCRTSGIRTARRVSHVFIMDVTSHP
jgi:phosphate acetyltransferase